MIQTTSILSAIARIDAMAAMRIFNHT